MELSEPTASTPLKPAVPGDGRILSIRKKI